MAPHKDARAALMFNAMEQDQLVVQHNDLHREEVGKLTSLG
jgi:hypothetical protein